MLNLLCTQCWLNDWLIADSFMLCQWTGPHSRWNASGSYSVNLVNHIHRPTLKFTQTSEMIKSVKRCQTLFSMHLASVNTNFDCLKIMLHAAIDLFFKLPMLLDSPYPHVCGCQCVGFCERSVQSTIQWGWTNSS